jgi:hypothetical protein
MRNTLVSHTFQSHNASFHTTISDNQRLMGMGIPRTLFRLTDAFSNFKSADGYDEGLFFGRNESAVKFVDEPSTISDDNESAALIKGPKTPPRPKFPYVEGITKLIRRKNTSTTEGSTSSSTLPRITTIPTNRGKFHQLVNFFFPEIIEIDEPNDHTFYDHYKMDCEELDAEDALEPLHDEMMLRKAWLLLELMPMKRMWQERGKWRSTFLCVLLCPKMLSADKIPQSEPWEGSTYAGASSSKYTSHSSTTKCEARLSAKGQASQRLQRYPMRHVKLRGLLYQRRRPTLGRTRQWASYAK